MATTSTILASGDGWQVTDVTCNRGPRDRPFAEQHSYVSIAAVTHGTFQYRSRQGSAVLVPGSLLLGNAGACYECGHEHAAGDRCLAFHMTPDYFERALGVDGAQKTAFTRAGLPPLAPLMPILAAAESARDERDASALEELTVRLAGTVISLLAAAPTSRRPTARDERRISLAARQIEAHAEERLSIVAMARDAAMSPYHFLRTFRQVTGVTPHQYILRTRLHRAALRLRDSDAAISAIAYDAGFNDLSTFNRRFRRLMGDTPGVYRVQRRGKAAA